MADEKLTANDVDALFDDPPKDPGKLGIPADDDDEGPAEARDASISFADLAKVARAARPDPAPKAPEKDATQKAGEDSGLADILSVAAALKKRPSEEPERSPSPVTTGLVEDEPLTVAVGGFGAASGVAVVQVKSAQVAAPRAGAAPVAAAPPRGTGGKWALVGVLVAGVGGLGYVALTGEQPRPNPSVAAPRVDAPEPEPERTPAPEPEPEPEPEPADGDLLAMGDEEAPAEAGEPVDPAASSDGAKSSAGKAAKSDKAKKPKTAVSEGETADAGEPAPDPDAEKADPPDEPTPIETPPEDKGTDVDCLLNPDLPGCTTKKKVEEKAEEGPVLPEKLSQTALRTGFERVKPAAKTCGEKNNVPGGTKVKVKVSIEGATGKVIKAVILGEYDGTSVGRCIEVAVKQASFDQFGGAQMGITWPFVL